MYAESNFLILFPSQFKSFPCLSIVTLLLLLLHIVIKHKKKKNASTLWNLIMAKFSIKSIEYLYVLFSLFSFLPFKTHFKEYTKKIIYGSLKERRESSLSSSSDKNTLLFHQNVS